MNDYNAMVGRSSKEKMVSTFDIAVASSGHWYR
jgi:hypothetical protein